VIDGTPYEVKVSRTVLRGERESNLPDLPDVRPALEIKAISCAMGCLSRKTFGLLNPF
jgi:hypothetical protein